MSDGSDARITCIECGCEFAFAQAERAFYEAKGLSYPPKRCRACRLARRPERGGAGTGGKARYDIRCAACGAAAQVPFVPAPGRRVYCHPCHLARKQARQAEGSQAEQGIRVGDDESGIVE